MSKYNLKGYLYYVTLCVASKMKPLSIDKWTEINDAYDKLDETPLEDISHDEIKPIDLSSDYPREMLDNS